MNYGQDFMGISRDAFVKQRGNAVRDSYMGVARGVSDTAAMIAIGAMTGGAGAGAGLGAGGAAAAGGGMSALGALETDAGGGFKVNPLTATFSVPLQFAADRLSRGKQERARMEAGQQYDAMVAPMERQMNLDRDMEQKSLQEQAYINQTEAMRRNVIPNRVGYLNFM